MNNKNNARISLFFGALLTLFCLVGNAGTANAAFIVYICDDLLCTGGGDTIVTDQGVGDNFPGSAFVGEVNAGALNVGGFTIVTNVSQSKPTIGSSSQPQLNLAFNAVTTDNGTHTVYLYASDTGFISGNTFLLTLGGQSGAGANSVTAGAWGGNSNTNLNLLNPLASTSSLGSPFSESVSGTFSPTANPYGLTIGIAITRSSAGTTGGGLNLSVTNVAAAPETGPSALLMGIGLLGLFGLRRALRT